MKTSQTDWKKIKIKIKEKFTKLSDADIEALNGHMELLIIKVQKAYVYNKAKATKECEAFTNSLKKN